MHTDTLPATAAPRTPWHRQRWPWFLMLGPGIVVVAGFATLWIAFRSDDGLVADDYYRQGLAINQTLDRTARSAALGLHAAVDVASDGAATVVLTAARTDALPAIVRLRLIHPTRAGLDRTGDLVLGPDGRYRGKLDAVPPGRRLVVIESEDWRLGPVEVADATVHLILESAPR